MSGTVENEFLDDSREDARLIELTLSTEFVPGTNLAGDKAWADWRFMLPRLRLGNVLCLDGVAPGAAAVLASWSEQVYLLAVDKDSQSAVFAHCQERGKKNVSVCTLDRSGRIGIPDRCIDLVYLPAGAGKTILDHPVGAELERILKPDAIVFQELAMRWPFRRQADRTLLRRLFPAGYRREDFWVTPPAGEFATAVGLWDGNASSYFFRNVLHGQRLKKRALSKAGLLASRAGILPLLAPRRAVLTTGGREQGTERGRLPEYVIHLAEEAGLDFRGLRFALAARGRSNSNKVILFLFRGAAETPEAVIKITRAPEYNFRLENEFEVLSRLESDGYADAGSFPEPLFLGHQEGHCVLCLRGVDGKPFRAATSARPDCVVARDAMEWLLRLGHQSASRHVASPADAAAALQTLFQRFTKFYRLSSAHQSFLEQQIRMLGESRSEFPAVLQHGDPGTWNMMVSDARRVIVIDWEAGERHGMPLWDLFYFFRTYMSWVSRKQGTRDPLVSFGQHVLHGSELGNLLRSYTARYRELAGLDAEIVEPLFFTCWMHRALKEAARLKPEQLDSGHYVNLLRLVIDNREKIRLR